MQGVDPDALEAVVGSFYMGTCPMDLSNVVPIFDCASKLEVASVKQASAELIDSALSPETCLGLLADAKRLQCDVLTETLARYLHTRLVLRGAGGCEGAGRRAQHATCVLH